MQTPKSAYISSYNDVTKVNLRDHYPKILAKLDEASHVALDLEFAGLCRSRQKDMNHRYVSLKRIIERGSMLSLGLSIFSKNKLVENTKEAEQQTSAPPYAESYICDNFNFLTLKSTPYYIDNDTKRFLTNHGFKFDRHKEEGIPFTPPKKRDTCAQVPSIDACTLQLVWDQILAKLAHHQIPLVIHNGLHDLIYLYSSFINRLPEKWTDFVAKLPLHFPGGIYDTKYLVEKGPFDASFLTYAFAKSDRSRQNRFTNSTQAKPYFEVNVNPPIYSKTSILADDMENNRSRSTSPEFDEYDEEYATFLTDIKKRKASRSSGLEQVQPKRNKQSHCYEFAAYGYCNCHDSDSPEHDVQVILDNELGPSIYPQVYTSNPKDIEGMEGHHSAHFDAYMTAFTFLFLKRTLSSDQIEEGRNAVKIGSDNLPVRFPCKKIIPTKTIK